MPCLRFVNAMFTLRKSHVYASQIACLQSSNDGVLAYKHALQRIKNVKTEAFLPQFCINIQNDRKTANKALSF